MARIDPTDTETARFEPSLDRLRRVADAPLSNLRLSVWWLRKTFFTRPRSATDYVRVARGKPALRELFGRNYFEPGWETSYQYRNEILNYRRVEYDGGAHPAVDWWQTHVRGYPIPPDRGEDAPAVELTAHYEPEPVEHPDRHVEKQHISVDRGMETMRRLLDDGGVDYEYVEYEP